MIDTVKLLFLHSKQQNSFELKVSGVSMLPVLHDGDTISACRQEVYTPGDILVYVYKHGEVLVHRLLRIENERYFCKGDNAFRLEDIAAAQIIGAVKLARDPHRSKAFLDASYQMSRVFRLCGYNVEITKQTREYLTYYQTYLMNAHYIL